MTEAPLLRVRNVIREFGGVVAVNGVTFDVAEGTTLGLVGPNGAGKTTLFNLIAGALPPTSGRVILGGRDVTHWSASRRCRLGMARSFQNLSLMTSETVLTNVLAKLHTCTEYSVVDPWVRPGLVRRRESALCERAMEWIHRMGLDNYAHTPITGLSFGLARRAELAGLLAMQPRLLLLDEPTAGLAGPAADTLLTALRAVQEEHGVTVVVIAHDMGFVMEYAREVVVMADGRVIARGEPAFVRRHPAVIEAYLGSPRGLAQAEVAS